MVGFKFMFFYLVCLLLDQEIFYFNLELQCNINFCVLSLFSSLDEDDDY